MRRHGFDPFSLVAGLLFGFMAVFFLAGHETSDLAWPWAAVIPLFAVGLLIVLLGLRRAFASDPGPSPLPGSAAAAEGQADSEGQDGTEDPAHIELD